MAYLVLYLLTLILYVQGTLSDELLNTMNQRGSNVTLKCGNNNRGCQNTEWHKLISNSATTATGTIYKLGQFLNNADQSRYSVDNSPRCDLTIRNLMLADAGFFSCRFFMGTTQTAVAAHLAVLESPSNCKTSATVEDTAEGDGVNLTCEVTYNGSGSAVISWNGKEGIRYPAQMYNLTSIRNTYNIIAKGPEVPAYECVTKLSFQGNPNGNARVASNEPFTTCRTDRISVSYPVRNIRLSPQQSVYYPGSLINCSAEGHPTPTIKWQKRESSNDGSTWEDIPDIIGTPLNISHSSDVSYRCIAHNSVRKVNHNATSSEFMVNHTGEPYEITTTVKLTIADPSVVAIAAGASVGILFVLILVTVCFCFQCCPGYKCCHKSDKKYKDKIRESDGQPLTERPTNGHSNSAVPTAAVRPRPRPAAEPPQRPQIQPPPQPKPRTDLPKHQQGAGNAYDHEEVQYAMLESENEPRKFIPKPKNALGPESEYADIKIA